MTDASPEYAAARRDLVTAAILAAAWWEREAHFQTEQAERWQHRVELAERHQEFDLATAAAQRARHHAAQALAAVAQHHEQAARVRQLNEDVAVPVAADASANSAPGSVLSLEDRFAALEAGTTIDGQLAAIKAGKSGAGA
jgi:phage shock protein A